MAPRAMISCKELMGSFVGQVLLCLHRGLREQSRTVQPPTHAGMHLLRSWKCHIPSGNTTRHGLAVPAGDAEVLRDPPAAASQCCSRWIRGRIVQ